MSSVRMCSTVAGKPTRRLDPDTDVWGTGVGPRAHDYAVRVGAPVAWRRSLAGISGVPATAYASVVERVGRAWGVSARGGSTLALAGRFSVGGGRTYRCGAALAIFDQAVSHLSRFSAPVSTIKGENLLGDHFDLLLVVLAPWYWVWSNPVMLLLAQSVLVGVSAVPVFLFARSRLGARAAYLLASAYAVFWGLQVGVGFEFHELAFAPLLIALAILFADQRRWRAFWIALVLLLCVKEDLSLLVVFFGIYLITVREVRRGLIAVLLGVAWFELATRWAIPHFAGGHRYTYWSYTQFGNDLPAAAWTAARSPWRLLHALVTPSQKATTLTALLGPFLFLSLLDRRVLLAVPLLLERFLSSNSLYSSTHFHYSMAIAPILAMSAAAGLHTAGTRLAARRRCAAQTGTSASMLVASLVLTLLVIQAPTLRLLTRREFYRGTPFAPGLSGAVAAVPPGASVITEDAVLPFFCHRTSAAEIYTNGMADYLVTNVSQPVENTAPSAGVTWAQFGLVVAKHLQAMTPVYYNRGWVVARRPPAGQPPSNGVLIPLARSTAHSLAVTDFAWRVALGYAFARLQACSILAAHGDPRASGCVSTALNEARPKEVTLSRALGTARAVGGCRELQRVAADATGQVAADLGRLGRSVATRRTTALQADGVRLRYDFYDLDLPGRLDRFLILCSPRRPGAG